jgi:hypothetical protein
MLLSAATRGFYFPYVFCLKKLSYQHKFHGEHYLPLQPCNPEGVSITALKWQSDALHGTPGSKDDFGNCVRQMQHKTFVHGASGFDKF